MTLSVHRSVKKFRIPRALLGASLAALVLAGCQVSELATEGAHLAPLTHELKRKISKMGMDQRSPILVRIFKEESALEVWKRDRSGRYQMLKEYEICAWSGELGPKFKEGDRQAPEGFYTVTPGQMNPNSSYHLSFNIGFPNQFDRSHNRTGSHLMVHGDCSSRGCYAMEDDQIEEIYALAREAFRGGQQGFQIQAFPFRMTPENMARHADNKHLAFWEMLKEGSDHFEVTRAEPDVDVCGRRYVFNATPEDGRFSARQDCPAYDVADDVEQLVAAKTQSDLEKRQKLITRAVAKKDRDDRWAEREKAIASFFDRSRSGEDESTETPAASDLVATQVASVGTPVPRPAPRAAGIQTASAKRGGLRFPNPFKRGSAAPVASTSGIDAAPAAAPEVAPSAAQASPQVATANAATTPQANVTPVEPLAYAPAAKEEGGFFSGLAKGSRGIFRRAGSVFN
ncbi:MAG: murein L,D-transpeptidase family protein [Pseudomonadota bacterium]